MFAIPSQKTFGRIEAKRPKFIHGSCRVCHLTLRPAPSALDSINSTQCPSMSQVPSRMADVATNKKWAAWPKPHRPRKEASLLESHLQTELDGSLIDTVPSSVCNRY